MIIQNLIENYVCFDIIETGDETNMADSFYEVLDMALYDKGLNTNSAWKLLQEEGVKISRAAFYQYSSGACVPKYARAATILQTLGVEFDEEELVSILNESEKRLNNSWKYSEMLSTSIKVNYRKLIDDDHAEALFRARVEETSSGVTDYISKLIRKDLSQSVLKKGEDY